MDRRLFLAWLASLIGGVAALLRGGHMRPWVLGDDGVSIVGSDVSDGLNARVTDPVSGAGLFNPNTDPAVVGVDPLTGSDALAGTDVSFGAAIRRQLHTNVVNGDFAVAPPDGTGTAIDSDPASGTYNPLPGWTLDTTAAGIVGATVETSGSAASGQVLRLVAGTNSGLLIGGLTQYIGIPRSQGQQYRVLLSSFATVTGGLTSLALTYQYTEADLTPIGSLGYVAMNKASSEFKLDAGLVPANATYILVGIQCGLGTTAATATVYEVRAAFLPAEAEVGLRSITANTGAITNSEAIVADVTIPAGTFTVGSVYRVRAYGTCTSSAANAVTFRVRIGTSSLSGNIAATVAPTATTTASANGFELDGLITIRSVGASGSALGGLTARGTGPGTAQPFSDSTRVGVTTATVAVDTTVANTLELTAVTAAGTTSVNFYVATIECVMAS